MKLTPYELRQGLIFLGNASGVEAWIPRLGKDYSSKML